MSVPVNERTHGKLEACVNAHDLCIYSLRITANKKIFKNEYDSFTKKIEDTAINIHSRCWSANNIYIANGDEEAKATRQKLQTDAIVYCNLLLSYIDIAKNLYHLDTKRVRYWTGLTVECRKLIRAWRDSERRK